MTKKEKLRYLINELSLDAKPPDDERAMFQLFRALVNAREPLPDDVEFLRVQDSLLKEIIAGKGIADIDDLTPVRGSIYLWRGDITTLKVGAIVNAANSGLLGCFVPNHACIDNAIHTFAGVQLRLECAEIMARQGHAEKPGGAKITKAYNLPTDCVLHTVGPYIQNEVTTEDEKLLSSSYRSCLELAAERRIESVAFCCISTGMFRFPNERAAKIAVKTVEGFIRNHAMKVVFNVFTERDHDIYKRLLSA
jgi:O-acetyl-ADP-ribose deacetylase (regulator of RNase III)